MPQSIFLLKFPIGNFVYVLLLLVCACGPEESPEMEVEELAEGVEVVSVSATLSGGNYTFSVELSSPDTGCDQYADWWEVIDNEARLRYRRILTHSHVDEQPFTRSGGPVTLDSTTFVWIRGHMNNLGYGAKVFRGSLKEGFVADTLAASFGEDLAQLEPLPANCAF